MDVRLLLLCVSLQLQRLTGRPQTQQTQQTQSGGNSLSWSFPPDPVDLVRELPVHFQLQQPDLAKRFAVRCRNDRVDVEVSQDLLGLGRLAAPEEVTLGHCPPSEVDDLSHVLVFESKLHECGSTRLMTDRAFIYAFDLLYNPEAPENGLITRSQRAAFQIQCHYSRNPHVSSGLLLTRPRGDSQPRFSMQLMSGSQWFCFTAKSSDLLFKQNDLQGLFLQRHRADDWNAPRISNRYGTEDVIRIQASVLHRGREPVKVLLDHCISTVLPAPPSEFDQAFVKNHGCLGGRQTGSTFMARPRPDELQFQIKASSFPLQKMVLLSCVLKAVPAASPTTIDNKSCFFDRGWRALHGNDPHCRCCAATCGMRKARGLDDDDDDYKDEKWRTEVSVGPIIIL